MRKLFTFFSGFILLCCLITSAYAQNDTIPPVVLDFSIGFQETGINDSVDAVFTVTYSENIQLMDTFTIVTHIYNNMVWEEYDRYDTTEIVIEGNVLTITPEKSFWSTDRYEFIVTSGSVQDSSMNKAGSFARTFVADEDVPEVIDHSMEFTEAGIGDSVSAVFTLTYSEAIQLVDTFQVVTHILKDGSWPEYDRYDESEVVINGSTMTITPEGLFSARDRYELIVTFGSVTDLAGNIATSFTRVFVGDVAPPEAVTLDTEFTDTEFSDSLGAVFTLTYNEDVKLAPAYSFLTYHHNEGVWQEYEIIADTNIMVSGHTVTLHPKRLFSTTQSYELVVVAGSIRDLADNPATSFTEVFLLDTIRPKLLEISPDLTMPVPTNAIFTFIFDENVRLADDFGFYTYLWDADSAKYIEYEQLDASQATVENNVVTFDPSLDFRPGEQAQIILTSGSVLDMDGNRFQYPRENDTLNYVSRRFWTAESGVTYITFLPGDEDSLSYIPAELSISFSDAITLTDSSAVNSLSLDTLVYLLSGGVDLAHEASFNTSTNVITIIPEEELAWGSSYTFGFADGFLNEAGDSIPAGEATFTILDSTTVVEEFTIAEINGQGDVSPEPGQVVNITGTITGIYTNEGFFVQDAAEPGSGIWVEYAATTGYTIGDGVVVTGMVDTLQNVTVFIAEEVNTADDPLVVNPVVYDVDTDSVQMYRNVLVQILNVRASAADGSGEWVLYFDNEADSVTVNSRMFTFSPADSGYYNVTGIVTGWGNIFRIEPRMEADVSFPTGVDLTPVVHFNVYPNPFRNFIKISNADKLTRIVVSNIAGQRVIDVVYPTAEINTSQLISGVYIINMFSEDKLVKTSRIVKQ